MSEDSSTRSRLLALALYTASTCLGIFSFLSPFLAPTLQQNASMAEVRTNDMPLMMGILLGLCLLVLLYEAQGQAISTKLIAILGVLVAVNAVLRFVEVAIPGPGGFSPVFFLVLLTGYVYGGRFGFLMGALTMFVSAIVTGGVGPWLPGQMFTAGWVGMSAPLCRPLARWFKVEEKRGETILLSILGATWGVLYGAIMNLWAWPYMTGPADQYWTPGISVWDTVTRYGVYYLVTSLAWDLARSAGNVLFILAFGVPTLRTLRRFQQRFSFQYVEKPHQARPPRPMRQPVPLHTGAWIAWLLAAMTALSITRNPLYIIVILLSISLVEAAVTSEDHPHRVPISPLRFTLFVTAMAAAFNALTSHFGKTVLLTIPGSLPLLSGPVTLEALIYGAINGLVLSGMFTTFTVVNGALPLRALIRLIPRAFYPVAVISSIALTFVPTTLRQLQQIREAQAIRGHRLRGLRDWLPLMMPLLIGGMERALQLAEAMTARGFASAQQGVGYGVHETVSEGQAVRAAANMPPNSTQSAAVFSARVQPAASFSGAGQNFSSGIPLSPSPVTGGNLPGISQERSEEKPHYLTLLQRLSPGSLPGKEPYARSSETASLYDRVLLLIGLGLALGGWILALLPDWKWVGLALIAAGALLVLTAFWLLGRLSPRSTYRTEVWTWRDSLVIGGAALTVLILSGLPAVFQTVSLSYTPYPLLQLPQFQPLIGLAPLGLIVPVVLDLFAQP